MVFDEKSRKSPSPALINRPTTRLTTTTKPKQKADIVEPEIDIESVPVLQGSFEVTKTDADIIEKKVRTSTLKPFTITNGGVRMKPKKPTIEKVRPLAKVPENPTANILKLDNVTKAPQTSRITTNKVAATGEEISTTLTTIATPASSTTKTTTTAATPTAEVETRSNAQYSTTTSKLAGSTSFVWNATANVYTLAESNTQATSNIVIDPVPSSTVKPITKVTPLEGEILYEDDTSNKENPANVFPSQIVLDNQPWQPIQPNPKPINYSINDAKKKINNPTIEAAAATAAVAPTTPASPALATNYDQDPVGFQLLPRNKLRTPIPAAIKPKIPPVYQGYNPGLMYGFHEVERLGNGAPKPYPLPVDLIGDQLNYKKDETLVLNKGEILPIERDSLISITSNASTPSIASDSTDKAITLNMQETTEKIKNKTDSIVDEQVGEILLDLLKDSNVKINASDAIETIQSRNDDIDISAEPELPELQHNKTQSSNEPDVDDHTEALDEIATALSSMETLSFKNIKDYIMATTKSIAKEAFSTTTERDQTSARRGEKPQNHFDSMIKSDRIALPAPISSANRDQSSIPLQTSSSTTTTPSTATPTTPAYTEDVRTEPVTTAFVEVDTVEYTPGTSWNAALFPVQSKWEYVNGSLVYPSAPPMRKIFNETLQAWIIENPAEATESIPLELMRNNNESLKNISAIFDTLASDLALNMKSVPKLSGPSSSPATPKLTSKPVFQPTAISDILLASRKPAPSTTPSPPPSSTMADDELPILLNQNTESFYSSSAETFLGQAEVEEVDPTQYEQMLLIDRVSTALRTTSTVPPLITLMPVKSNSGIRHGVNNDKWKNNARGFPPVRSASVSSAPSGASSNKRRFQDTSFIIRTNINVGS